MLSAVKYSLYDDLLEGVQVVDIYGKYIYVNDAVAYQGRRSKEELIGSSIQREYPGIEQADIFAKIKQCHEERRPMELINEFIFPDGSIGYFKLKLKPADEGVLILSVDLTEFRNNEIKIAKANAELQNYLHERIDEANKQKKDIEKQKADISVISNFHKAILDNTTDSIVLIGCDHKILCFNREIQKELFKYFHKNIEVGDDYREFVVKQNQALYLSAFDRGLKGETIVVEDETKQADVAIWFQYKVNPVYNEFGQILGIALTATNIDVRKRKELALKESEDRVRLQAERIASSEKYYRTLIETSSDAVVLLNEEGKVTYQTPSTEKILGYNLKEIQALDGRTLIHPDDSRQANNEFLGLAGDPGKITHHRLRIKHKVGHYIWIDATYRNMLNDPDVHAIVLNYSDATDKVLFEETLKKTNRELSVLNKINDIILRNSNEVSLYNEVCECIIKSGGYKLAWVCLKPDASTRDQTIIPIAAAGEIAYLNEINIALDDSDLSKGPTGIVLQTGRKVVTHNVTAALPFKPWVEKAQEHGISASIVLPLNFHDGTIGAINIYSTETNAFDDHESLVLERVAKNLSLAIYNIRVEKDKEKAQYLLKERVKELTTIYHVNKVLQNEQLPVDIVFTEIVTLLPNGWQFPEICAAKIIFDGQIYETENYSPSPIKMAENFSLIDGRKGSIEVTYTEALPPGDEEPFLKEEQVLLNTLAETITVYFNKVSQQKALVQSESYFRSSFEYAAIGKALTSLDGKFFKLNKAFCNMLGYTEKELLNTTFYQITHQSDINADAINLQLLIDGTQDFYRTEKRYIHKNGSIVWGNLNIAVIRDGGGKALHFVSQIENVTERKKSEASLIQSEANMKTIFNNTDVAYLLIDEAYNIVSFNGQFKNSFEIEAGTSLALNSYLFDVVPKDRVERMKAVFDKVVTDLTPIEYEYKYSHNNSSGYYSVKIVPVISDLKTIGICLSATDITNRKMQEMERQTMIDDLLQRNSDLQQFAHIVSHNVRGPLATILGLNALLEDDIPKEELHFLLDAIKTSSEKLDIVIRDLNKILQVKRELSEAKVYVVLKNIVDEIKGSISLLISESRAKIVCDFTEVNQLLTVRSYINSIFYNLISNSIKYSKPNIPPVIEIRTQSVDGKVIISFKDNGIGIDLDKHREKMFMLYQKFHLEIEGRGMGLFMTKTQVEVLKGSIDVESELGIGTTFRITLPE